MSLLLFTTHHCAIQDIGEKGTPKDTGDKGAQMDPRRRG